MSLQRGQPMKKTEPLPVSDIVMPLLIESAKELLDDERVKSESICLAELAGVIREKIYGKLWKQGQTGLALMLGTTGWLTRFVAESFKAVVMNLREKRGDANA